MNLHVNWVVLLIATGLAGALILAGAYSLAWQLSGNSLAYDGFSWDDWTPPHITYSQHSWGIFFGNHGGPPEMCKQRKQKCANSCFKSACVHVSDLLFSHCPKQVTWPSPYLNRPEPQSYKAESTHMEWPLTGMLISLIQSNYHLRVVKVSANWYHG